MKLSPAMIAALKIYSEVESGTRGRLRASDCPSTNTNNSLMHRDLIVFRIGLERYVLTEQGRIVASELFPQYAAWLIRLGLKVVSDATA